MYPVYIILISILVLSFITGNMVLFVEHKQKKDAFLEKHILIDRDVL